MNPTPRTFESPLSTFGIIRNLAGQPLGVARQEDENLHAPAESGHFSATETSYFGFNIPAQALNGEIYMWFHPVLRVMSASVYIWRGLNKSSLSCEYVNHYHYLPFPAHGIADYEIPEIGLRIKVIRPLEEVEIAFHDAERNVKFDLKVTAIMPPAIRPGGFHFTQAMRTKGQLDLYGEILQIDGYFSRDRSWGQERREASRMIPPFTWMVGVIDDSFAFHATAIDSAEAKPEWLSRYAMAEGANLIWGYVFRDGTTYPLVSVYKSTVREADGLSPCQYELVLNDVGGGSHKLIGDVVARMPWQTWQNINVHFCLTRWSGEHGIGWGDAQDIQQNDFVRLFGR